MRSLVLLVPLLAGTLAFLQTGCRPSTSAPIQNGHTIKAHGVTYRVPWENGGHTELPSKFTYEGESGTITEIGGKLRVNGKSYGSVQSGDTVSLLEKGRVLINDAERLPE